MVEDLFTIAECTEGLIVKNISIICMELLRKKTWNKMVTTNGMTRFVSLLL